MAWETFIGSPGPRRMISGVPYCTKLIFLNVCNWVAQASLGILPLLRRLQSQQIQYASHCQDLFQLGKFIWVSLPSIKFCCAPCASVHVPSLASSLHDRGMACMQCQHSGRCRAPPCALCSALCQGKCAIKPFANLAAVEHSMLWKSSVRDSGESTRAPLLEWPSVKASKVEHCTVQPAVPSNQAWRQWRCFRRLVTKASECRPMRRADCPCTPEYGVIKSTPHVQRLYRRMPRAR